MAEEKELKNSSSPANGSNDAFVSEGTAALLLGRNKIVTAQEASEFWQHTLPEKAAVVRYTSKQLMVCSMQNATKKADWRLVYAFHLQPLLVMTKIGLSSELVDFPWLTLEPEVGVVENTDETRPVVLTYSADFLIHGSRKEWAAFRGEAGYRLIDFHARYPSCSWGVQEQAITCAGGTAKRADSRVVLEAISIICALRGEQLLTHTAHWGERDPVSGNPILLTHTSEGIYINSIVPGFVDWFDWLGVCVELAPLTVP